MAVYVDTLRTCTIAIGIIFLILGLMMASFGSQVEVLSIVGIFLVMFGIVGTIMGIIVDTKVTVKNE